MSNFWFYTFAGFVQLTATAFNANCADDPKAPPMLGTADHWVATDALDRKLPQYQEVGLPRSNKTVGIFYFLWNGNHTQRVYDVSKIISTPEGQRKWGPKGASHFGSEPEYGYFHSSDPWVIRRDMQMLVNAKIDFLYLDVTNAVIYKKTVAVLLETIKQMRREGIAAPAVSFVTNAASGKTINSIYEAFYSNPGYANLWFQWEGKPLIFGKIEDPELRSELITLFTIKRCWAWTPAKQKPDHWQWLDKYPQDYGWHTSPEIPDQISVSAASHPTISIGKSYQNGIQPAVGVDYLTSQTANGLHFEEQWSRAHEVDPKVVMITQWNEWIAGRSIKPEKPTFAGREPLPDGTWFVDVFGAEFSRDLAPMRGGYTDNYYYQMIGHIRRFKGIAQPPVRPPHRPITIDGKFEDWHVVPALHYDPPGDVMHRKFRGTDPKVTYENKYGRNDFIAARVVESNDQVHFLVTTKSPLTPHTDEHWMTLLIDTDQNKKTGWQGYDLAVNTETRSNRETCFASWSETTWQSAGTVPYGYADNQLELSISNTILNRKTDQPFDFKWVDNVSLKSLEFLFLQGDAAPDRRFNYRH